MICKCVHGLITDERPSDPLPGIRERRMLPSLRPCTLWCHMVAKVTVSEVALAAIMPSTITQV